MRGEKPKKNMQSLRTLKGETRIGNQNINELQEKRQGKVKVGGGSKKVLAKLHNSR